MEIDLGLDPEQPDALRRILALVLPGEPYSVDVPMVTGTNVMEHCMAEAEACLVMCSLEAGILSNSESAGWHTGFGQDNEARICGSPVMPSCYRLDAVILLATWNDEGHAGYSSWSQPTWWLDGDTLSDGLP